MKGDLTRRGFLTTAAIAAGGMILSDKEDYAFGTDGVLNDGKAQEHEEFREENDPVLCEKQSISGTKYLELIDSFTDKGTGEVIYPEYYGGAFVDEKGELNIYIKGNKAQKNVAYSDIGRVIRQDDYNALDAKYSQKELKHAIRLVVDFWSQPENKDTAVVFPSYYLDERNNRLVVQLLDTRDSLIELFQKSVLDSSMIVFEKSLGLPTPCTNINPGGTIRSTGGSGSVAYRAKKAGVAGIVTAGHVVLAKGNDAYVGTTKIGKVTAFQMNGNTDAAFVEITNSSYVGTNSAPGSVTLSTTCSNPAVGTQVVAYGQTTKETIGKVLSTDSGVYRMYWDSGSYSVMSNITLASNKTDRGDSGGIVYGRNNWHTCGVVHGKGDWIIDGKTYTGILLYCKASLVNSTLGISRY